ncbi:MAG: VTT domain-containing protein, partial [Acidimicrobiia bacterium]|nr:VTT domain-containing protein [Acidimicrobiia bacterium]
EIGVTNIAFFYVVSGVTSIIIRPLLGRTSDRLGRGVSIGVAFVFQAIGIAFIMTANGLPLILVGCFMAAVTGDQVGYAFGRKVGPALFRRPDSRFFKKEYLEKAQSFFDRYGAKTILLARFVPIVRTFAPIVAGAGTMHYRTFVTYNLVGGLLWAVGVTLLGYMLGELIPDIDAYLLPIIAGIIFLSFVPIGLEWLKARKRRALRNDQ